MIARPTVDPAELEAALALRIEVFCGEQGVSLDAERDGHDAGAMHLVTLRDGAVVGTCRLRVDGERMIVQRVAVRHDLRGRGVGAALLDEAQRQARLCGATTLELHAQVVSEPFYAKSGYERFGAQFLEEGIEHIAMRRRL